MSLLYRKKIRKWHNNDHFIKNIPRHFSNNRRYLILSYKVGTQQENIGFEKKEGSKRYALHKMRTFFLEESDTMLISTKTCEVKSN